MILYFGLGFLFLASALLCAQFSAYQKKRLLECEGLWLLLEHIRGRIVLYLAPYPDCVEGFQNTALENTGLIYAIFSHKNLQGAWESVHQNFSLNDKICKEFYTFCQNFGKGYANDEEKLLTNYIDKFQKILEDERKEAPRTAKLVRTLVAAGGCAIAVLLL